MKKRFLGSRSGVHAIIGFASNKCRELIFCESKLEYDRVLKLEFDLSVKYYEAQPETYEYTLPNGKTYPYTPDLRIYKEMGETYLEEIKPREVYEKPEVFRKYAIIRNHLELAGHEFRIVTDTEIRNDASVTNYRKLYPYLIEPLDRELKARFMDEFFNSELSLKSLRKSLTERGYPRHGLNQFLAHGLIAFDHAVLLSDTSRLSIAEQRVWEAVC